MKRATIPNLVLAATLAVLLPLNQWYCACMGSAAYAAPTAASSPHGHGCCEPTPPCGTEQHSQSERAPDACTCAHLLAASLPAINDVGVVAPWVAPSAVPTVQVVIARVAVFSGTDPALDVGSPSIPDDPGAHGLRAPPVSA